MDFNQSIRYAQDLVKSILTAENMDPMAATALMKLGDIVIFKPFTASEKHVFTFELNFKKTNSKIPQNHCESLQLKIIKGSVFTYVWSTFARFDDEYALYHCSGDDINQLWHVKGVDALNAKIGNADVDWFQMLAVKNSMDIEEVTLLVFSKLLGRLLLSLPYFVKTGKYIAPMPASFMFNYMMVVVSTPFAVSIRNLAAFLANAEKFNGRTNQDLVRNLMTVNGAGMSLSGYHPFAMLDGRKFLLHSATMRNGNPSTSSEDYCLSSSSSPPLQRGRYSMSDISHPIFHRDQPPSATVGMAGGMDSLQYHVRTIELLERSNGVNGLLCRLECVHNTNWSASYKFLALDVYSICQAMEIILQANHNNNMKADCQDGKNMPQIEIIDEEDWNNSHDSKGQKIVGNY